MSIWIWPIIACSAEGSYVSPLKCITNKKNHIHKSVCHAEFMQCPHYGGEIWMRRWISEVPVLIFSSSSKVDTIFEHLNIHFTKTCLYERALEQSKKFTWLGCNRCGKQVPFSNTWLLRNSFLWSRNLLYLIDRFSYTMYITFLFMLWH